MKSRVLGTGLHHLHHMASQVTLSIDIQLAGGEEKEVHGISYKRFQGPALEGAYIIPPHIPLAGTQSHRAPDHKGGWEV